MITAAAFWEAARAWPPADLQAIAPARALILAPHPDDESLGCGGFIAEACARNTPPFLAVLTDGAGSHPNSRAYPPARLRALREAETIRAVACLGLQPTDTIFLRHPDTSAPTEGAPLAAAAAQIANLLRRHDCGVILAPWRHDPHGDHLAAHRIATLAAQQTGALHRAYPVWGLTLPPGHRLDTPPSGLRLDIARHQPAKRRAILCHASQYAGLIDDDPAGFQMQDSFMALFDTPSELFLDPA